MTFATPAVPDRWLPLRLAFRELRSGLSGFYVFIGCIALGVMAIAGVGSFSKSLTDGLSREGRVILGGDLAFSLIHREADATERGFLDARGQVSAVATLRAMARTTDDRSALVEIKAVDGAYPLTGAVALDPVQPLAAALAEREGVFGAAADPTLLARLDLKPGARLTIGTATFVISAVIASEPDKLASGIAFGPRVIVSEAALRATGLIQPGSLVRWHYRVRLANGSDSAVKAAIADAAAQLPEAGWEVRSRTNASPALERNVERFTQYLTLVGLTALLVGGVGVANAVKSHLDRKRDVIATMKSLGATGRRVFAIYLIPGDGDVADWRCDRARDRRYAAVRHRRGVRRHPAAADRASPASGRAGARAALRIAHRARLRDVAAWPRPRCTGVGAVPRRRCAGAAGMAAPPPIIATAAVIAALAVLAVGLAYDRKIALIFIGASAAVFVALDLVAVALMAIARRLPHARAIALRLAIANIHRPGALTPTIVLSLGLGLALLVTVVEIDGNLRQQFMAALPEKAPAFFFLDIQGAETEALPMPSSNRGHAPRATFERVPMLRGRIVQANGIPIENVKVGQGAAWALQSDRGITFANAVPQGSRLADGEWWGADYNGPPLVSFENKVAEGLKLKLGDAVVVNVLGRNITARVANTRRVDWETLGINFVMVFSPNTFAGAPHADIATLTYPPGGSTADEIALLKAVADAFPSVTTVRVKDALEAVGDLIRDQPRARDPRRECAHAARGRARARRGIGGRPPPSRLRRRYPQDARCDTRTAHWRLCARISDARHGHRTVRRRGRFGRGLAGRRPGHDDLVCLAARAGRHCVHLAR